MPVRGELREHERLVGGKAEDGIADEYAGTYETDAGDDEQDRAKQAAPGMRREREPKPDSNQGNEGACNDKIHDLGPTEPSDRQGTDRIAHPVVLRTSKTFDQKCDDEERCAKGTKPKQKRLHEIPLEIRSGLAPWRLFNSVLGLRTSSVIELGSINGLNRRRTLDARSARVHVFSSSSSRSTAEHSPDARTLR